MRVHYLHLTFIYLPIYERNLKKFPGWKHAARTRTGECRFIKFLVLAHTALHVALYCIGMRLCTRAYDELALPTVRRFIQTIQYVIGMTYTIRRIDKRIFASSKNPNIRNRDFVEICFSLFLKKCWFLWAKILIIVRLHQKPCIQGKISKSKILPKLGFVPLRRITDEVSDVPTKYWKK